MKKEGEKGYRNANFNFSKKPIQKHDIVITLKLILVSVLGLFFSNFVLADGWTSSQPSHATLYADTLTSKTDGLSVNIADLQGLFVTGDIKTLGNVGIGTTGPEVALHVNASTDTVVLRTQDSSNFKCDMNPGSAADWSCSSDARLKTNIRDLESSLGKVMALQPRRFNLKANGKESVGFIAQEVQEVLPDMVDDSELDNLKVSTGPLVPRLVKAMQELKQENNALKEIVCIDHPTAEVCKK